MSTQKTKEDVTVDPSSGATVSSPTGRTLLAGVTTPTSMLPKVADAATVARTKHNKRRKEEIDGSLR